MTSHLGLLVLFACFVSLIFAVLMRDQPSEQLRLGARLLAGFVGAALVLGWLMYPLPF
jgi:heme A synthase